MNKKKLPLFLILGTIFLVLISLFGKLVWGYAKILSRAFAWELASAGLIGIIIFVVLIKIDIKEQKKFKAELEALLALTNLHYNLDQLKPCFLINFNLEKIAAKAIQLLLLCFDEKIKIAIKNMGDRGLVSVAKNIIVIGNLETIRQSRPSKLTPIIMVKDVINKYNLRTLIADIETMLQFNYQTISVVCLVDDSDGKARNFCLTNQITFKSFFQKDQTMDFFVKTINT